MVESEMVESEKVESEVGLWISGSQLRPGATRPEKIIINRGIIYFKLIILSIVS